MCKIMAKHNTSLLQIVAFLKMPHACGAPYGATSTRAQIVRSTPNCVGRNLALLIFAIASASMEGKKQMC